MTAGYRRVINKVKAVYVTHTHGVGAEIVEHPTFRAMAQRNGMALIKHHYDSFGSTPADSLIGILGIFARLSGRPELANVPYFAWGHSNRQPQAQELAAGHPERCFGFITHKSGTGGEVGNSNPEFVNVPHLGVTGEREKWGSARSRLLALRAIGLPVCHIIEKDGLHGVTCRVSIEFMSLFVEKSLKFRVPPESDATAGPIALRKLVLDQGWLGDPVTGVVGPFSKFNGLKSEAFWFVDEELARAWRDYHGFNYAKVVPHGGFVFDARAGATLAIEMLDQTVVVSSVEYYDGETLLGQAVSPPFQYQWKDAASGTVHVIAAKVFDSQGGYSKNDADISALGDVSSRAPFNGGPAAIPGTVEAENYDRGGEMVTYHDVDDSVPGRSTFRAAERVDVLGPEGGAVVGFTEKGEWMAYTVNVMATGAYTIKFRLSSDFTGALHVAFDGVNETGTVETPSTGGWSMFTDVAVPGVVLESGPHVMTLGIERRAFNIDKMEFVFNGPSAAVWRLQPVYVPLPHSGLILCLRHGPVNLADRIVRLRPSFSLLGRKNPVPERRLHASCARVTETSAMVAK